MVIIISHAKEVALAKKAKIGIIIWLIGSDLFPGIFYSIHYSVAIKESIREAK